VWVAGFIARKDGPFPTGADPTSADPKSDGAGNGWTDVGRPAIEVSLPVSVLAEAASEPAIAADTAHAKTAANAVNDRGLMTATP
jgi:hypothetical protein